MPAEPSFAAPQARRLNAPARTGERALPIDEQLIGAPQDRKGALRAEAKPRLADKSAGLMPHPVSNHRRFPLGIGGLETARYTKKDAYRRCITTGGPLARALCVACEN